MKAAEAMAAAEMAAAAAAAALLRRTAAASTRRHRPAQLFREASPSRRGGSGSGDGARETAARIMVATALEKAEEMVVEMAVPHSAHALRSICKNALRSLDRSVRASR